MMESDDPEPQREALEFQIDTDTIPHEMAAMMIKIKEVAESMLYHWKVFPIVLPESLTLTTGAATSEGTITFRDLFVAPNFDELEEVATDSNGELKKLTVKQLDDVYVNGEFDVESIHFPSQHHRWHLSELIQKGTLRSHDTFLGDAALALRLLIVTAKNRFYSHFFSLSQSLESILNAMWLVLDIAIGMPSTTPGEISTKLREEHSKHLIAELDSKPQLKKEFSNFCEFVREKLKQLEAEKHRTVDLRPPLVPYQYQTAKGQEIDLRLFNRDLMKRSQVVLKEILERETKGWFIQFKENKLTELRAKNLSHDDMTEDLNNSIQEEYLQRVYTALLACEDLELMSPGLGMLLVQQAKSVLIMSKAAENIKIKMHKLKEELRVHLKKTYSVKSRIKAWVNERLLEFEAEFISQNMWSVHEESIAKCREAALDQAVYFLHRDLNFMKEREPVLRKELSKVKHATREYNFHTRIWFARDWIVKRHLFSEVEVIPTVIVETPTAITAPRNDPNQPTYTLEKYRIRKTTSRYPFWRWMNYVQRTWAWTWGAMFWLGVVVPFYSPVGLLALFSPRPFMPDYIVSQVNGALCPKVFSLTQTMVSRLRSLWRHVRASRAKFENEPDTGFLGKSFTRYVNRIWNFGVKGVLGSVGLVLIYPTTCLFVAFSSLLVAVFTPVWMPVVTLFYHIIAFLFYDFDNPRYENNCVMILCEAVIWRFLIMGVLQPIGALLTGILCCPIASFFVTLGGILRYGGRRVWDNVMFHAIIKRLGRVPSSDGFVARRVEGPGLASNFYYQIAPEQALAALESMMELHQLQVWSSNVKRQIEKPVGVYRDFIHKSFYPFSGDLVREGMFDRLDKETKLYISELNSKMESRKFILNLGLNPSVKTKVKLTSRDIKLVIAHSMKLVESFYPLNIISKMNVTEERFWEDKQLEFRDWKGLTCQLLSDIFSPSFLVPLEEADKTFRLEVEHLNLARYIQMMKSMSYRDDLDVISAIHTPKGELDIVSPFLEPSVFDPRRESHDYSDMLVRSRRKWPWKRPLSSQADLQKLEIPPPIPHPTSIAIYIYNRQNDQQPIRSEEAALFYTRIMRAAEKSAYSEQALDMDDVLDHDDIETSTPDHTTTSDPDITVASHLAVQERAFSEDNVRIQMDSTDSGLNVTAEAEFGPPEYRPQRRSSDVTPHTSSNEGTLRAERRADSSCVLSVRSTNDSQT